MTGMPSEKYTRVTRGPTVVATWCRPRPCRSATSAAVISASPWRPMITTSSPTRASGTSVRSMRVCSSDGPETMGTARPRTSTRPAWSQLMPSAEPMGITPSRIGAFTGKGASSAKRSRGASSLSAMTREVSARSVGRSGSGDVSPGKVMP